MTLAGRKVLLLAASEFEDMELLYPLYRLREDEVTVTVRRSEAVLDLVRAFDSAGKPIAFICHAGWVPISARIVKGRRATSVAAIRDDMVNAGVDWVDQATVVDGNLISARTPADLGPWMKALLHALDGSGS
jgi:protease I